MLVRKVYGTEDAALLLGVSTGTMKRWRHRSVGPAYARTRAGAYLPTSTRSPLGFVRVTGYRHWAEKAHGTVKYSRNALEAYAAGRLVPRGRLPRPFGGRLPGGAPPNAAAPARAFAGAATPLFPAILAAWLIGVTPTVLRAWRRRGIGPAYARLPSGRVRYALDAVLRFRAELDAQRRRMPRGKGRPTQVGRPGGTPAP